MKLLILTNNYPRKNALNNGIFIHQQVKALQQAGVECHVLLLHNWFPPLGLHSRHPYWQQGHSMKRGFFEEYEGVKVHAVPMFVRIPSSLFKDNHYDCAARSVIKYVKGNKELRDADWIYAHFLTENGYIGAKIKDSLGMQLAAIARGDDIHAWPEEKPSLVDHLRLVFDKADLLLANSGNLAHDAGKWMELGKERKVEVVYNGIDHSSFHPVHNKEEQQRLAKQMGLPEGKKYMVCIGTPVALKGWRELLHAMQQCRDVLNDWVLLTVAPPRDNKDALDLPAIARELGIEKLVHYMGGVSPADVPLLLRAVDAFVLPSYNEGMSNSLLEAMASGLPCIATEVGGHNEVITNKSEGLLVPPRNVPALADAIRTITADENLRKNMGANARQQMLAFGDYAHNAAKLLQLLKNNTGK